MPETTILDERAVSEIEDRANMAEPGPWQLGGNYWDRNVVTADKGDHFIADCGKHPMSAEFIAHAREDIPALCRTVKHLWAQLAEWEQHRPGIVEAVQTAETTVDDLQSQLEQLRAENVSLRKEVANSEKYQAQLLDGDSQVETLHYFKDRGDGRCVICGNLRLWQFHVDEEIDPATAMRDKCVEKVKAKAEMVP